MHLFLSNNWLPHRGGSRQYAHELLTRMPSGTFHVITRTHPEAAAFDAQQPYTIQRIFWPNDEGILGMMRQFCFIVKLFFRIRACRPTCVHAGDPFPCGVAAWLAWRLLGIPYVMYAHDEPLTPGLRVRTALERMAFSAAAHVVVASSWAEKRIAEEGISDTRISRIMPAIEPHIFHPIYTQRQERKPSGMILSIGRLVAHKGMDSLVRAMPGVLANVPHAKLVIIGDGPERAALEQVVTSLGLQACVSIRGGVSDAMRAELLTQADILALASRPRPDGVIREGVGIVLLEAAACGVPVVASRLGGLGDSIVEEKTGILLPPEDEASWAKTLSEALLSPEKTTSMGEAAHAHIMQHFTWSQRAELFSGMLNHISQTDG